MVIQTDRMMSRVAINLKEKAVPDEAKTKIEETEKVPVENQNNRVEVTVVRNKIVPEITEITVEIERIVEALEKAVIKKD